MTLKDLHECRHLADEMQSIQDQVKVMEAKLFYAKALNLDGMPRANGATDGADMLVKYIDLKDKYQQRYIELSDKIKAVEKAIEKLDATERRAIRYRYLQGLQISDVAAKMAYTERQIHRILRAAESKLCDS